MTRLGTVACALVVGWAGTSASTVPQPGHLTAADIVTRSVAANQRDWQAAPSFDCFERDRTPGKTVTYKALMIDGSPYLVRANAKNAADKVREEIAHRHAESASERASRIRDYNNERERDRLMLEQLAEAFTFSLRGRQTIGGRRVYVIDARPRQGYAPPNEHARALTGMEGTLWIDTATFNWARVAATVTHPVSIYGFLATVEPGTRFDMEKMPVSGDIWQPTYFAQVAHSRILGMISHSSDEDIRYWNYVKANNADPLK